MEIATGVGIVGAFGGVLVSKVDYQTITSEFESHWVPHPYGLLLSISKKG